jgi:uncharacterized protein
MRPLPPVSNRTRNSLRFSTLVALASAGVLLLVPARMSGQGVPAQVLDLPPGTSSTSPAPATIQSASPNKPDWSAPLIHPLDQMRTDPHRRVYAAVITRDHKTLQALLDAGDSPEGYGHYIGFPLIMACQLNDLESASGLLKSGANVNQFWRGGTTPLMTAAEWGHVDLARYLLVHGALPNEISQSSGDSALFHALNHRNFAILTLLIENGADVNLPTNSGTTPLQSAALDNDLPLVRFLQDHGAKFNSPDEELLYCAANGDAEGIQRLLAAGAHVNRPFAREVTPLMAAAVNGQTAAVKTLIAHGANINAYDEVHDTPLMFALKGTHKSTVMALLDAGADPTLANVAQVSTLHQSAIYMDDPEIVHRLLDSGLSPTAGDRISVTPLMNAAAFGHYETVKILLAQHVPVNVQSSEGLTALIHASTSGQANIVALLLRAGADPSVRDKQNRTALDHARQMHQDSVVALLDNYQPPQPPTP